MPLAYQTHEGGTLSTRSVFFNRYFELCSSENGLLLGHDEEVVRHVAWYFADNFHANNGY